MSKQRYYNLKFENATGNYRQTWSLINELRGKSKDALPSHFTINGLTTTDKKIIANKFNNHFGSLAENLSKSQSSNKRVTPCFSKYLPKSESSSIFFEDTTIHEVNEIVTTFSNEKSSDIPIIVVKHYIPILFWRQRLLSCTTNVCKPVIFLKLSKLAESLLSTKNVQEIT